MAIFETVLKSDLKKPVQVKQLSGNLFSGDNQGNKITVEVMDNGSPATLSGGVKGYIIREDNITVEVDGTLSENKASIIFPQEAYNVVGNVCIAVKVDDITVGACTAYVYRTTTDSLIDSSDWIPSLAEIEAAAVGANKVANLTVSAEAATGSTPDAVLSETGTGSSAHKHITFKLVKGDKGNTGDIPQFSIGTISSLSHGATPTASIDNTDPEHPILSLGIPAGASGNETIDDTAGIGDTDLVYSADKVRKELDTKAPVVDVPLTTPASVQSFHDGAEGLPMALKVAVDPVQDLHGYDNPWPAGGGKNLLENTGTSQTVNGVTYTVNSDGSVTANGTATANGSFSIHSRSAFLSAGSYKLNGNANFSAGIVLQVYSHTQSANIARCTSNNDADFSIQENEEISVVLYVFRGQTLTNFKFYPMIRLASESDGTFAPYSNICPISGWTGANVTRTGKNLLKSTGFVQGVLPWEGDNADTVEPNPNYITSEYIPVKGLTTVTVKHEMGNIVRWYEVDEAKKVLYKVMNTPSQGDSTTFLLHNECAYIRLTIGLPSESVTPADYGTKVYAQIESGPVSTEYEPYLGTVYPISFPSQAGTVYGGTLTVNKDGSGSLVVDRAKYTQNDATNVQSLAVLTNVTRVITNFPTGAKADSSKKAYSISNYLPNIESYTNDIPHFYTQKDNFVTFYPGVMTGDQWLAYVTEHPLEIVYFIENPITIDLFPVEVTTLLGINNLWSNTGDIALTYRADTKKYIDKKFAELSAAITALGT